MNEATPRQARHKTTSDLAFAGYAHMRGLRVVKAEEQRGGRFSFVFDDPDDRLSDLWDEFVNSECANYDASIRILRKFCQGAR